MTTVIIVFGGLGAAVAALAALLMPDRPTLLVAVGRLDAGRAERTPAPTVAPPVRTLTGRQEWLGHLAADWGLDHGRIGRALAGQVNKQAADLAVTERSDELHLGRKVLTGLCGLCLLPAAAIALYAVGVRPPALSVFVGAPPLGVAFYFVPDLALRREAEERRRGFRRALSCYLDLVAMSLAGGRGAPQALPEAAALSDGWAYRLIGDALAEARLAGHSPWRRLGELGERIGVPELCELAGSLALVGDHGARVRDTLTARAATLRRRALTDAEGQASQADQSMRIAQVLLAFGFLILIAYPALAAVLAL